MTARERMVRVVAETLDAWVPTHGGALMETDEVSEYVSAAEAVVAALEAEGLSGPGKNTDAASR